MTDIRGEVVHKVLLDGLVDCVDLSRIHWWVEQFLPAADASELQRATIDAIWSLVTEGLADTGYPCNDEFVSEPPAEFLKEVQSAYIAQYDEPITWFRRFFVNLTEKGFAVATSTPEGRRIAEHERLRLESIRALREQTSSGTDSS